MRATGSHWPIITKSPLNLFIALRNNSGSASIRRLRRPEVGPIKHEVKWGKIASLLIGRRLFYKYFKILNLFAKSIRISIVFQQSQLSLFHQKCGTLFISKCYQHSLNKIIS